MMPGGFLKLVLKTFLLDRKNRGGPYAWAAVVLVAGMEVAETPGTVVDLVEML